jgi:hypothetical protein
VNGVSSADLLVVAVAVVGTLHTLVPDHWAPIALLARQRGWSVWQTAKTAAIAGFGHTLSTLLIAAIVWLGGLTLARHYGQLLSVLSSVALVGFGSWIAIASLREIRRHDHEHGHPHFGHSHIHRHDDGSQHRHWHQHRERGRHEVDGVLALSPSLHAHAHETSSRTALLLILGSSPMIEGIPAFFAASRFGSGLLVVMGVVFATCTIATYVVVSVASARGAQNVNIGPLERYGEVLSGAFIAGLGLVFLALPSL